MSGAPGATSTSSPKPPSLEEFLAWPDRLSTVGDVDSDADTVILSDQDQDEKEESTETKSARIEALSYTIRLLLPQVLVICSKADSKQPEGRRSQYKKLKTEFDKTVTEKNSDCLEKMQGIQGKLNTLVSSARSMLRKNNCQHKFFRETGHTTCKKVTMSIPIIAASSLPKTEATLKFTV